MASPAPEMDVQPATDGQFFALSPLFMFPRAKGEFGIYLKLGDHYVLYAHPEETFDQEHRQRLHEYGVENIYVLVKQREAFAQYLEDNLGNFLLDDHLPMPERSRVFYNASLEIVRDTFQARLPTNLAQTQFDRIKKFVSAGTQFLAKDGSLKNLASLIVHDYQTYSHCVHVFVFSTALLQTYEIKEEDVIQCGLGAILHDLGKLAIPKHVLNKRGPLSKDERALINTHPLRGVAMLAKVPLTQDAVHCVLFHHERHDGAGYPSGLAGADTPLPVKAIKVCDVYAALTAERPYAPARKPFEALSIMRDEMNGHFDQRVLKRLVVILSGAAMV